MRFPWTIKDDISFFKIITTNCIVVMGKNTYDSLPQKHKPLKDRLNIVLTNSPNNYESTSSNSYINYDDVFSIIENNIMSYSNVFVIGGVSIYELFYNNISSFYVTYIDKSFDVDKHFPMLTNDFAVCVHSKNHWDETEECYFRFEVL